MEEVRNKTADLAADTDNLSSGANHASKHNSLEGSLLKIYRRGDKIYQVKEENVTMMKDCPIPPKPSKVESDLLSEEIVSGESLFKTFSFDNEICPEEVEKCLTFWRSVVEKNLEPIKCTIIENSNKLQAEVKEKNLNKEKKQKAYKKKPRKETPKSEPEKQDDWLKIILEMQKKRLTETKLMIGSRCRFCGYTSSPLYETPDVEQENERFVKKLEDWKPKSHKRKSVRVSRELKASSSSITGRKGSIRPGSISLPMKEGSIQKVEEEMPEISEEDMCESIKEEADKIKFVNIIEKKKQLGAYSRWRKNQLEPCTCNRLKCDCNINPAIESIGGSDVASKQDTVSLQSGAADKKEKEAIIKSEEVITISESPSAVLTDEPLYPSEAKLPTEAPQETPTDQTQEALVDQPQHSRTNQIEQLRELFKQAEREKQSVDLHMTSVISTEFENEPEVVALPITTRSLLITEDSERKRNKTSRKSLSVVEVCACGNETCDCKPLVTLLDKPVLSEEQQEMPEPPKIHRPSIQKVNSLELIQRKFSVGCVTSDDSNEDEKNRSSSVKKVSLKSSPSIDSLEIAKRRLSKSRSIAREESEEELAITGRKVSIVT